MMIIYCNENDLRMLIRENLIDRHNEMILEQYFSDDMLNEGFLDKLKGLGAKAKSAKEILSIIAQIKKGKFENGLEAIAEIGKKLMPDMSDKIDGFLKEMEPLVKPVMKHLSGIKSIDDAKAALKAIHDDPDGIFTDLKGNPIKVEPGEFKAFFRELEPVFKKILESIGQGEFPYEYMEENGLPEVPKKARKLVDKAVKLVAPLVKPLAGQIAGSMTLLMDLTGDLVDATLVDKGDKEDKGDKGEKEEKTSSGWKSAFTRGEKVSESLSLWSVLPPKALDEEIRACILELHEFSIREE